MLPNYSYRSLSLRDEPGYIINLRVPHITQCGAAAWNPQHPNPSTHYIYNLIGGLENAFAGYYANGGNLSYLTMDLMNLKLDPTGIFPNELTQIFNTQPNPSVSINNANSAINGDSVQNNYPDFKRKLLNFSVFGIPNIKRGMQDPVDPLSFAYYTVPGIYYSGQPTSDYVWLLQTELDPKNHYAFPYPANVIDPYFSPPSGFGAYWGTWTIPGGQNVDLWLDFSNNLPLGYNLGNNSASADYATNTPV